MIEKDAAKEGPPLSLFFHTQVCEKKDSYPANDCASAICAGSDGK